MSGADEILLAWGPGESRLALLEQGRLIDFQVERDDQIAGALILGRVADVVPALDAAFVDIGQDRPGFLPGGTELAQGQAVLVQVRADAQNGKGAVLTTAPTLTGRCLVYTPGQPGIGVSRHCPPQDADRLRALLARMVDPDEGVMIRSHAQSRDEADIRADLAALRADWAEIEERRHVVRAPTLVWRPDPLARALADNPEVRRVRIDDAAAFAAARQRFGPLVEQHRGGALFEDANVEDDIAIALSPAVSLPGGGRLIIETTAALTTIDVDSGAGRASDANWQAVEAIARQIRLRAIGGQIVVDFVSGGGKGMAFKLAGALKRAVADDPVPVHVHGVGPLGLVELTRERRRAPLAQVMTESDRRPNAVAMAFAALRRAVAEAPHHPGRPLVLTVADEVANVLARRSDAVAQANARIGLSLTIRGESGRDRENILIEARAP